MLEIEDFYLDKLVLRQVKRQELEGDLVDVVPATMNHSFTKSFHKPVGRYVSRDVVGLGVNVADLSRLPLQCFDDCAAVLHTLRTDVWISI
jgi:hypothetical protein